MSFTNKTPNYNLPQWLGTDKPSWLVDVNGAFSSIDTAVKNAADSGSGADATAKAALETAQTAQETANSAMEQADNANTKADSSNVTAGNAQTAAGTALTNANNALSLANSLNTKYSIIIPRDDIVVGPGLTKGPGDDFVNLAREILFYYPGLKLMEISFVAKIVGTATNPTPNTIDSSLYDYKIIKLPFTCTGSLYVNSGLFYITKTGDEQNQTYSYCGVRNINGETWLVTTSNSNAGITYQLCDMQMFLWLNVASLGTITLDGWTAIE